MDHILFVAMGFSFLSGLPAEIEAQSNADEEAKKQDEIEQQQLQLQTM